MSAQTHKTAPSALRTQLRRGLQANEIKRSLQDIADGWERRTLWGNMGLHDVRQRYRRSILGPFWITISMGIMVTALGFLYGKIFRQELSDYLPYLSSGFIVWGFIAGLITDGSRAFINGEQMIRQISAPVSIYVYRAMWTNIITFMHNIWIFIAIALWYQIDLEWTMLLVVPALALVLINGMWVGLLIGLFSVRFRDVPLIVSSVIQVMFFITPVIWRPEMLPGRALILDLNPFYHFVAIVRAPLLGHLPVAENWVAAIVVTIVGWVIALIFYCAYRWRIAYWA